MSEPLTTKKLGIWVLSTVAAAVVGLGISFLFASKPSVSSDLSGYRDEDGTARYRVIVRNDGDTTLRTLIARIYLVPGPKQDEMGYDVGEFLDYSTEGCSQGAGVDRLGTQTIEIRCELLHQSHSFHVQFQWSSLTSVRLHLSAVGYRYYAHFHPVTGEEGESSEVE